jgi:hypothetical protein
MTPLKKPSIGAVVASSIAPECSGSPGAPLYIAGTETAQITVKQLLLYARPTLLLLSDAQLWAPVDTLRAAGVTMLARHVAVHT